MPGTLNVTTVMFYSIVGLTVRTKVSRVPCCKGACEGAAPVLPSVIQLVHDPAEGEHDAGFERSPHAGEHDPQSQKAEPASADSK